MKPLRLLPSTLKPATGLLPSHAVTGTKRLQMRSHSSHRASSEKAS